MILCQKCRNAEATVHVTAPVSYPLRAASSHGGRWDFCLLCGEKYLATDSRELLGPYAEILKWRENSSVDQARDLSPFLPIR